MIINLDLSNLLLMLIIGIAAGFVANSLAGKRNSSILSNMLLGLAGAFVGGIILPAIGLRAWGLVGNFIAATVGAVIILVLVRAFSNAPTKRL